MIKDSAKELVYGTNSDSSLITKATEKINERENRGIIFQQALLMGTYQSNLEDLILRGSVIVINPINMVSYFTISTNGKYEIISEKEIYTEKDIRLMRFPDGHHWYAKISNIDVVVDGNMKWNSRWVAKKNAKEYLKTL